MQEISGRQEDILFDLEQIKLLTQQKDTLTDNEKDKLKRLPLKKRKAEKEAVLKEKETKRKEFIRIWIIELEDKVKNSNLPPEIKAQILDMTTYAKERNMTFMYSVEEKIDQIQTKIREAEEREEQKKRDEFVNATLKVAGTALATATVAEIGIEAYKQAHPDWYHVQYSPEKLEQMRLDHFEHTFVQEMAEMKLPYVAEKTYPKKQGSQYTKAQQAAQEAEEKDVVDFAYQQAKQAAEKMGKKAPDETEFKTKYWPQVSAVKKRVAEKTFAAKNPEKAKKRAQDKLMADQLALEKGIERLRRKHAKKEIRRMKGISKRLAMAQKQPKRTNNQILKVASQATKSEERVREKAQEIPGKPAQKPRVIKFDFKRAIREQKFKENLAKLKKKNYSNAA